MILDNIYASIKNRFSAAALASPALDARLLICHALGLSHERFILENDRPLSASETAAIEALAAQRLQGRPIAKIIGQKEFYGRHFKTTEATLDPRPDSETLVEAVLRLGRDFKSILDLGTGTGCLLLTLLAERPGATGVAVDQSAEALAVARDNATALGLDPRATFIQSDWLAGVTGRFDIIVSNPPYIPAADIFGLAPDVRLYDPMAALDGGLDGLDPYRLIIPQLDRFLNPGGSAAFEVGKGQDAAVADMLRDAGFQNVAVQADLGGINRVVVGIELHYAANGL